MSKENIIEKPKTERGSLIKVLIFLIMCFIISSTISSLVIKPHNKKSLYLIEAEHPIYFDNMEVKYQNPLFINQEVRVERLSK